MTEEPYASLKRAKEEDGHLPADYCGNNQATLPALRRGATSDNEWWTLYEEGEHEVSCPHCDGDFTVSTRVSYSFSTDEQPGA